MVNGSCTAIIDRGNGKEDISLDQKGDAIEVGNYVWHGFKDFSDDALLLAISSKRYTPDRSDYIEDYEEYQQIITKMQ
jgi:dTDP-4-dehydrorhamnose 3,5-epimerase-like enzyme